MKCLIWSDNQFHNWREFSRILPNGRNSRFQDQLNALAEVFEAGKQCDLMIHDGDLFESRADTIDKQVFLTVYNEFRVFSKFDIPIILNVGNHDWLDRTETSHILQPFKEIPNVVVIDTPKREVISDCVFAFLPYTRQNFSDKVNSLILTPGVDYLGKLNLSSYLFTHQGVSGAKTGPRDINIRDEYHVTDFQFKSFRAVFNGHYHKPQKVTPNFYIIGSTIQKDFGERGERKGYRILDTATQVVDFVEINSSPKFFKFDLNTGVEGIEIGDVREQDFVWLHSLSPIDEKKYREAFKTLNVRITVESQRKEVKPRSELNVGMDIKTQFNLYIQVQRTKLNLEKLLDKGLDVYSRS